MIFHHGDEVDQLCLALACKKLLQTSTVISLKTLRPIEHKAACPCRSMERLLTRIKPLNGRGCEKKSWAVCYDCMRYRPTMKSYWKGKRGDWVSKESWEDFVKSWEKRSLVQCPQCWSEKRRVVMKLSK